MQNPNNNNNPQAAPNNVPGNRREDNHALPPNTQEAEQDNNDAQPNPQEAGEAFNIPAVEFDEHGLPRTRERTDNLEVLRFKYAVVDHLSFTQCAGYASGSFSEVQSIWRDLQVQWAGAYSDATRAVMEALRAPHPHEPRGRETLGEKIEMVIPTPDPPSQKATI